MNTNLFKGMFARIMYSMVITALVFSATGIVYAQDEAPFLRTFPDQERVDGWHWPAGQQVFLEINGQMFDPQTADGDGYVDFAIEGYDLERGASLTMSSGDTFVNYIARQLLVNDIDLDSQTISGTVDGGQQTVHLWVGAADEYVDSDVFGYWTVDLSGYVELILFPGVCGNAEAWGETNSNSTIIDWCASPPPPNPHFTVFPEWEFFDGLEWPDGATVAIGVEGKPECSTQKESWDGFFNGNFGEGCDLEIGDTVTFTDGETDRTHTVQNLTVTKANHDDDTIKGIADPGAEVYVWAHATGEQQLAIAKTKGAAQGKWNVDFSGIYDLAPGECGRSEIRDEFANSTAVDWCIPNPRIIASESGDWFWTTEFKPGDLDIFIYDSPDEGANLLWSGQQVADESGFTSVGSDIHGQDLVPGNYLVISDGDSQKSLILQTISVAVFDIENEIMIGFAPAGSEVWAAAGPQDWQERIMVQADPVTGGWLADFNTIGFDIIEEMQPWSYAHVYDEDGDANEGSTPPPSAIVIANQPDWVDSRITISAGQSFTVEAVGFMNPCSDTYPNGADYCIFYTPLGAEDVVPYANEFGIFPGPGLRFMALLGRIGDDEPFYVGAGDTFTAEESGTLRFTPNDNLRTDNQGAYSVLVWFEP